MVHSFCSTRPLACCAIRLAIMPFRVPKLTLILQICKFEWGLLKEPLTSHVKIIERPWYWLTANTVQIMYIPNFYSYILGEFPDALHESSAIYWKPTPFITHLLLLWWLFPNAVQIFWKNTTKQLWRNWSQEMCKKMRTYFHWFSASKTVQNFQHLILATAVFCLKEL